MDFFTNLAIIVCIYSILSLSLNLLVGYTGLISMATAAFMGVGAYSTAVAMNQIGLNFLLALLFAVVFVGIIAFFVDTVLTRFKGDYFTLGSMGMVAIASGIFVNWRSVTNGSVGIANISRPNVFGIVLTENWQILIMALSFVLGVYAVCAWIERSSFGRVLKAIRDDEGAIKSFGYNTARYKLVVFVISSAMTSVAGGIFATYMSYISPVSFTITDSIAVLSMVVLGGLANNRGVLLGSLALVLLPEMLRFVGVPSGSAADIRNIIYGLILILLMLYRPRGLLGEYKI